jgi:uncharacterized membrane protein YqjE
VFDAIEKAKQVGVIVLERMEDYLELIRLDVEIQRHNFIQRILSYAITGICFLIAFVFFGFAIVVSFWETPYRILVAWIVVAFYAALAALALARAKKRGRRESALSSLSHELQEDIKLIKDLL